jgi:hypothetical protein
MSLRYEFEDAQGSCNNSFWSLPLMPGQTVFTIAVMPQDAPSPVRRQADGQTDRQTDRRSGDFTHAQACEQTGWQMVVRCGRTDERQDR